MKQTIFVVLVLVALTSTALASDEGTTLTTASRQRRQRCSAARIVEDLGCACFLVQRNRFPTTDRSRTLAACRRAFAPLFPSQLGNLCRRYFNRRRLIVVRRATRGILVTLARCDTDNLSGRNLIVEDKQAVEGTDMSDVDGTEIIDLILGDGEVEM